MVSVGEAGEVDAGAAVGSNAGWDGAVVAGSKGIGVPKAGADAFGEGPGVVAQATARQANRTVPRRLRESRLLMRWGISSFDGAKATLPSVMRKVFPRKVTVQSV